MYSTPNINPPQQVPRCGLCDVSKRRVVYGRTETTRYDGVVYLCDECDTANTINWQRKAKHGR